MGHVALANECIPQKDMAQIARDFSQFRNLGQDKFCLDGSEKSNLLTGIYFMRGTTFEAKMDSSQDELFSGRFASSWYKYFTNRISDITIDHNCPKGVGAYVMGWGGNTMYVCEMLLTTRFTGLDRASVFMHEARHIDGYPHVTCHSGPRAGLRGACDQRISDGGSYAVTVETYAQLARYATNVNPALKAYSRASAVIYADEAFVTPARVDRSQHFLLMTNQKDFYGIDLNGKQKSNAQKFDQAPLLGHIVMRAQHMILIPEDKTLPAQYVLAHGEGTPPQEPGKSGIDYNKATPDERAKMVDLHVGAQWEAKVYLDRVNLSCNPTSDANQDLAYNGEVASNLVYPDGYDRAAKKALLMMKSGDVYELGCNGRRPYLQKSQETFDRPYKRIYMSQNHVLALTQDGYLYELMGNSSVAVPTPMDGNIYELVPSQNFAFFDNH